MDIEHIQMETNTLENGKKINNMDKGLIHGEMVKNTLENTKMVYHMDMELIHGQMDKNILENIRMANITVKGSSIMGMEEAIRVSGKMVN